ncbi:MAG: hypothetical protein M3N16_00170 [Actinomycetota bacterium]|nr:hypothetical protein [Actinomycetota bacterium]
MAAVLALVVGVAALVTIAISFRGLLFLTLPLAIVAIALGVFGGREARTGGVYAAAMAGVVLGGVVLVLSLLALMANILISRDYELYETEAQVPAGLSHRS